VAFADEVAARLLLGPARAGFSYDAAGFASCCGPASCSPPSEALLLRFDTAVLTTTSGAALPGTLVSPRTGLAPAGCHELVARLHAELLPFSAPELLGAHFVLKKSRGESDRILRF
jgi:hypothetical protein